MDAFGRLRTSQAYTMFDYYPNASTGATNNDEDIWVTTSTGTGSCTYNTDNYLALSCTAGTGSVTRQTKQKMFYQAGKSRLMYLSTVMNDTTRTTGNVTTNVGIFSNTAGAINQGIFFQYANNIMYACHARDDVTTSIVQNLWNIDTFDGTGPSGLTLTSTNFEKDILIIIDQEWLGVGRVRMGFNIGGVNYYAHAFTFGDLSVPYTTTPRLPLSYQIVTDSTDITYTLRQICCSCLVEGEFSPVGRQIAISTPVAGVDMAAIGTKYILLALRVNPSYPNSSIALNQINGVFPTIKASDGIASLEVQLHFTVGSIGSISGSLTYVSFPNSTSQYALGAGTQTISANGYILETQMTQDSSNISIQNTIESSLNYKSSVTQYDTLYIIGSSNATTTLASASAKFIEIN